MLPAPNLSPQPQNAPKPAANPPASSPPAETACLTRKIAGFLLAGNFPVSPPAWKGQCLPSFHTHPPYIFIGFFFFLSLTQRIFINFLVSINPRGLLFLGGGEEGRRSLSPCGAFGNLLPEASQGCCEQRKSPCSSPFVPGTSLQRGRATPRHTGKQSLHPTTTTSRSFGFPRPDRSDLNELWPIQSRFLHSVNPRLSSANTRVMQSASFGTAQPCTQAFPSFSRFQIHPCVFTPAPSFQERLPNAPNSSQIFTRVPAAPFGCYERAHQG